MRATKEMRFLQALIDETVETEAKALVAAKEARQDRKLYLDLLHQAEQGGGHFQFPLNPISKVRH